MEYYKCDSGILRCGDCKDVMGSFEDNYIDLTVTSPPYDNLRDYKGYSFDFEGIAKELFRVTKDGGVVVWIVGDETRNFGESLTSFRQALYFNEIGFKLLDTMIYLKKCYPPAYPNLKRYAGVFEYMFILLKGKRPKIFNPLMEDKSLASMKDGAVSGYRQKDGSVIKKKIFSMGKKKQKTNVWEYLPGRHSGEDIKKFLHPATFPNELAKDHILSWSNEGDTVFDPFTGSGTTLKMAERLGRKWIGIEMSEEYCEIAKARIEHEREQLKMDF